MRVAALDEEALGHGLSPEERKARGAYFTPAGLVELTLARVRPWVPQGSVTVIDPACGAGAFLAGAARHFPKASLLGLELAAESLALCRQRLPRARLAQGNALRGDLEPLLAASRGFELWVGNPPYNGTSALLRDASAYARVRGLLEGPMRAGTSLRDDFAFFLLVAAERLRTRPGALAFVTSATLLDAYAHAPLRRALLERLELREVVDLGAGAFAGTRVRTCVTVWTSRSPLREDVGALARDSAESTELGDAAGARVGGRRLATASPHPGEAAAVRIPPGTNVPRGIVHFVRCAGFVPGAPQPIAPAAPEFLFRPVDSAAEELERLWSAGEPISCVMPISFPGLKTRFDELLVDGAPEALFERVSAFLACAPSRLDTFAREHQLPERTWAKLHALKAQSQGVTPDRRCLRPFFRYAGARHRGELPASARAFCYLDRRLIPRGDHRLRGSYDPHLGAVKLLFNVRELPLSAALLEEEGCVHDHRHARFAPLLVPARILADGLSSRPSGELGPLVPNLSPRALETATRLGGPRALFSALVRFINGREVQEVWAPAFGAFRELPIPLDSLE